MTNTQDDHQLSSPELEWNEQGLPISQQFDDVYFSKESGLEESRFVFLQHNHLPQRWIEATSGSQQSANTFSIFETGFGTGLNFLACWQAWQQTHSQQPSQKNSDQVGYQHLHFISVEKFPLNKQELAQALALWPELEAFSQPLIEQYPALVSGFHQLQFANVTLSLIFSDVADALPELNASIHNKIDAWFLDGFAPAKNPEMWSETLFKNMARLSHNGSTAATFTAAGIVRRGLKGAGFAIEKVKGYGRKREMVRARFQQSQGPCLPDYLNNKPWLARVQDQHKSKTNKVAIIGAGIAGCCTAIALARRGISCTVFDKNGIAQQASGNPQGAVYAKLAADVSQHSDFYSQGFIHSLNLYNHTLKHNKIDHSTWSDCGLLQLAYDQKEQKRQDKFIDFTQLPKDVVQQVSAKQCSEIAGLSLEQGALYYPQAGWLSPQDFCQAVMQHPLIDFQQMAVDKISKQNDHHWQLELSNGQSETFNLLVVANAFASQTLLPQVYLPIKSIRGQLSYFKNNKAIKLNAVLCAKGYISPAPATQNSRDNISLFCTGATYNLGDDNPAETIQDHDKNKQHLSDFGAEFAPLLDQPSEELSGRVAFRCTTPDYMPMAGPVLNQAEFINDFSCLKKNAKRMPRQAAAFEAGLYLNIGHGSRGLVSAPLTGEVVAAYINQEILPVSQSSAEALTPSRFFIRDMMRGKL